ncbi:MAG: protein phosphatase 2C domain-containing protein [Cyanobacteria bacterium Co-bin13]|nr:protein phosphatase 2C domain-containing protein [Cyanobacteria bacterium Co-bin13]
MIQCPNPACQSVNDVGQTVCQVCQTPLVRRFLWVADNDLSAFKRNSLLAERFQVWAPHILLDIRPSRELPSLEELPDPVVPYLRLATLPLHIPRPFTVLSLPNKASLLLLEDAPLATNADSSGHLDVRLLPSLTEQWASSSPLRQLNWLRQVALLWTALAEVAVEASLLQPDLLRVDGSVLRLLALRTGRGSPTLVDLGRQWQGLVATAHPAAREYLGGVVAQLCSRNLASAIALEQSLEQAIATLFQGQPVRLETATLTDQGPSRARNEDACYPDSGSVTQGTVQAAALPSTLTPLVVVCDGIGGHESGNVASQLAIQTVQQQLTPLLQTPTLAPAVVTERLKQAVNAANDAIAQRNDQEHRQDRERMGTTLVVALIYPPYLFIAHLGDSRAYRISAQSCCQITLDDDVAARETRLGYALYRDALNSPSAGALVQALGIGESGYLQPTVQHFLLDDDSLYLICSDGLSDFERVDSFWLSTIRPAVLGQVVLAQVGQQLVNLANGYNGHDNVTVGLVSLSPQPAQSFTALPAAASGPTPTADPAGVATVLQGPTRLVEPPATVLPPTAPAKGRTRRSPWPWLVGVGAIAAALLSSLWWLNQTQQSAQPLESLQLSRFTITPRLTPDSPLSSAVSVNSFWQVRATPAPGGGAGTGLLSLQPGAEPSLAAPSAGENAPLIPAGSILKVISRRATPDRNQWVRLQVCSIPSGASLAETPQETDSGAPAVLPNPAPAALSEQLSQPGEEGWILEPQFTAAAIGLSAITPTQRGTCP